MKHRSITALALLLALACGSFPADEKDSVKEKLFAAKMAYDGEMRQFRKSAEEWFDKREDIARKAGDKKTIDLVKQERAAFDENDTLPKNAPVFIQQKPLQAKKTLEAAYTLAVREYTKVKKDAEAAAVEAEWKALNKRGEGSIDLLARVNLKTHAIDGGWKKDGSALVCNSGDKYARLQLPYEPGEEYDVEVTCRRIAGNESLAVGLVASSRPIRAVFDGWPPQGPFTGLDNVDGKAASENVTSIKGEFLKVGKDHEIVCAVRSGRIDVSVDGRAVIAFKGEAARFEVADARGVPNKKALFLAVNVKTTMRFDRVMVTPVKGKGTILK